MLDWVAATILRSDWMAPPRKFGEPENPLLSPIRVKPEGSVNGTEAALPGVMNDDSKIVLAFVVEIPVTVGAVELAVRFVFVFGKLTFTSKGVVVLAPLIA